MNKVKIIAKHLDKLPKEGDTFINIHCKTEKEVSVVMNGFKRIGLDVWECAECRDYKEAWEEFETDSCNHFYVCVDFDSLINSDECDALCFDTTTFSTLPCITFTEAIRVLKEIRRELR